MPVCSLTSWHRIILLILSRKSLCHSFLSQQDVAELRAQITQAGVNVDVDAPKGQDLARIMEEMRAKYERIALKNQEDLKAWHETQVICQCKFGLSSCIYFFLCNS